ncbi:MAG: helix-turn-helix domain-containing protein [Moorea sp. SIO4G2]|nr:helix-turn-helix domain-containing protein [Moorena sp. SIO4G2]
MLVGCHRTTVSRWFSLYRRGEIEGLLEHNKKSGRPRKIPLDVEEKLRLKLQQPEGFSSYGEVQLWLKGLCGMDIPYATVYKYVRTRLKTNLKKLN